MVVYGEVTDIHYLVGENGFCRTNEDVKVLQTIKGNCKVDDIIKVVKDQGIIAVSDYVNSFVADDAKELNRQDFKQYSDEELDDIYIQQIEQSDIMSEKGQRGVYFLAESAFYNKEGTFSRITGPEAEYLEIEKNQFAKIRQFGGELNEPYFLSENFEDINTIDFLTLDDIISEIR